MDDTEELEALRAFWDLYWNGPGCLDYGDHFGYLPDDMNALDKAAEKVEDIRVKKGLK
jgi:hypothetical protein